MSRSVRRGVTRAGWNARHANWFINHMLGLAALTGFLFQSWLVFFIGLFVISLMVQHHMGRALILPLMCCPWIALSSAVGFSLAEVPGGIVLAFLGGGAAFVALQAGCEYFNDLA